MTEMNCKKITGFVAVFFMIPIVAISFGIPLEHILRLKFIETDFMHLTSSNAWAQSIENKYSSSTIDSSSQSLDQLQDNESSSRKIVLDPGHGGRDPGIRTSEGLTEKSLILDFALHLKNQLQRTNFAEVQLTRNKDEFLSLKSRIQKANELNADLFISLHVDASSDTKRRGLKIGILNSVSYEKQGVNNPPSPETFRYEGYSDEELGGLTWIPEQFRGSRFTEESLEFSQELRNAAQRKGLPLDTNFIQRAPFAVLKDTLMPSILLQVGFISNRKDLQMIRASGPESNLMNAIVNSIRKFSTK